MDRLLGMLAVLAVGGGLGFWWLDARAPVKDTPPMPLLPDNLADADADGPKRPAFAEDRDPKAAPAADVKFDGDRAMKYLKELCAIGPRVSGSDGMKRQQEVVEKHFKGLGAAVTRQEFTAKQRSRKDPVAMANLVISWNPDRPRRVILCSHYDTRPVADQEPNRANWNRPFVSANDGTSGVAWMMELGHHMKDVKTEFGVDFVLFDGEEYVFETGGFGGGDKYFFGSDHFADEYTKTRATRKFKYEAAVLFDLFAGKGAAFPVEQNSWTLARGLTEQLWKVAADVGVKCFKFEAGPEVQDDHLALNRAGIPAVDVIDFDYKHWHKLSDTPDQCDPGQMADVAKVIVSWLQRIR